MEAIRATGQELAMWRRAGIPFAEAWDAAIADIEAAAANVASPAAETIAALQATRTTWQAAYERLPAPATERRVVCPPTATDLQDTDPAQPTNAAPVL